MKPKGQDESSEKTVHPLLITSSLSVFTSQEWFAFLELRRRYREGQDRWDARELAQLHFLRWLRRAGGIES